MRITVSPSLAEELEQDLRRPLVRCEANADAAAELLSCVTPPLPQVYVVAAVVVAALLLACAYCCWPVCHCPCRPRITVGEALLGEDPPPAAEWPKDFR